MKILLIEDEKIMRVTLEDAIRKKGYQVVSCETGAEGLEEFRHGNFDVVVTDLKLPKITGIEVLKKIQKADKGTYVILMTAYGSVNSAVEALKMGAYDYLTKPFPHDELLLTLQKIEEHLNLVRENIRLKREIRTSQKKEFIGNSASARRIFEIVETVADSEHTVLIEGKSGTGKEVVANMLHYMGNRKNKPFIKVSCAALSENLLESELFGHEKGAFTGAIREKKGRFERANGGTIFLDDIDDMPFPMQVKLLRVLQEKEIERVGGSKVIPIDVRVICATKVDLREKIKTGEFREDLFYRLNVIPIYIPSLRERKEDIPLLVAHFLNKHKKNKRILGLSPAAMDALMQYNWPGNVRELENIIERMIALSKGEVIHKDALPEIFAIKTTETDNFINWNFFEEKPLPLDELVSQFEKKLLLLALKKCDFNQTHAAQLLRMKRSTMRSKLEKYQLISATDSAIEAE